MDRCLGKQITNDSWLQVHKDGTGYIFSSSSVTEEGGKGVVMATNRLLAWHLTIRLDAMLQAVQLPAGVSHLNTSLANVDRDALTLRGKEKKKGNMG